MASPKVVHLPLPRPIAEETIHRLATAGEFVIEPVCKVKIHDRNFTMRQVLETMKKGSVNQGPELDEYGEWRCRIHRRVAGRLVRVIVAIHEMRLLYVICLLYTSDAADD